MVFYGIGCIPGASDDCQEDYDNLMSWRYKNFYDALEKHAIAHVNFDTETIYDVTDLGKVISEVIDSTLRVDYEIVAEYQDTVSEQYKAVFLIAGKEYAFETWADMDYMETDANFELLKAIASDLGTQKVFEIPWTGDQSTSLVYASRERLKRAVEDGFPLTIAGEEWYWKNDSEWEQVKSLEVSINKGLNKKRLRNRIIETIEELKGSGLNLRSINLNRMYLACLSEQGTWYIVVDGDDSYLRPLEISDDLVASSTDYWSVLFQYVIAKEYGNGTVTLTLKNGQQEVINTESLLEKIERSLQEPS